MRGVVALSVEQSARIRKVKAANKVYSRSDNKNVRYQRPSDLHGLKEPRNVVARAYLVQTGMVYPFGILLALIEGVKR